MAIEVVMPQMGESVAEGTITKWLVSVGERVERDQPLFEISTDKVDAEIPSPGDGVLLEIRQQEGATVAVDEVVAMLGEAGEQIAAAPPMASEPVPQEVPEEPPIAAPAPEPQLPEPELPEPEPVAAATPTSLPTDSAPSDPEVERIRTHSSPVVRKMAAEHGLDISQIPGTGIHGRVTKADVENYLSASGGEPQPAPASESVAPQLSKPEVPKPEPPKPEPPKPEPAEPAAVEPAAPTVEAAPEPPAAPTDLPAKRQVPAPSTRSAGDFFVAPYGPNDNVDIEPMSKIRQITAAHMSYSKATSAHVTTVFHVDMSRVARIRKLAKEKFEAAQGTKLTYMPFIFRAVANALKTHRKINSAIDGNNIVFKRDINLGMAVALDWGLIVPVIKDADQLSLIGLAKQANDLADRARNKKLSPDEVQGGTFTITNPGVFGSLFGTPIINQPQVAILGLGAIEKRPVVVTDAEGNDNLAIKTMCYMAITYDHRLVDGADADHFMNDIRHTLSTDNWSELDPYV